MALNLLVNGIRYSYPTLTDEGWGPDASNWALAITQGTLQKAGGLFALTSDVDFGPTAGLKAIYYKSRSTNIAGAGQIRLSQTDTIQFRNSTNTGNLTFGPGSTDATPAWNGVDIGSGGSGITQLTGDVTAGPGTGSQATTLGITTTKGDLIVNNGTVNTRFAVGTNGQILTADSTQTNGVTWAPNSAVTHEFVYNSGTNTAAGSSDTTSFASGQNGTLVLHYDSNTAASFTSFQCRFSSPIQPTDLIFLEILQAEPNFWSDTLNAGIGIQTLDTAFYGMFYKPHPTIDTDAIVYFGNAGAGTDGNTFGGVGAFPWSAVVPVDAVRWRLHRISFGTASENTVNVGHEYVYNTANLTTAGGVDTTSFGSGPAGTPILAYNSNTLSSSTVFYCQFANAVKDGDLIFLEFLQSDGTTSADGWINSVETGVDLKLVSSAVYGAAVVLLYGQPTKVAVEFGNAGIDQRGISSYGAASSGSADWATIASPALTMPYYWRVHKVSFN